MKIIQQKLDVGLLYGENFVILTSTVFDWSTSVTSRQTDRQTGRRSDRWTGDSIIMHRLSRAKNGFLSWIHFNTFFYTRFRQGNNYCIIFQTLGSFSLPGEPLDKVWQTGNHVVVTIANIQRDRQKNPGFAPLCRHCTEVSKKRTVFCGLPWGSRSKCRTNTKRWSNWLDKPITSTELTTAYRNILEFFHIECTSHS